MKSWVFVALFLFSNPVFALSCRGVFDFLNFAKVEEYLKQNKLDRYVVNQCAGSCYFEGTISHLASRLSEKRGYPVDIHRVGVMRELLEQRLLFRFFERIFDPTINRSNPYGDVFSSGIPVEVASVLNAKGIPLVEPKTQAQIYREDKVLALIHSRATSFLLARKAEISREVTVAMEGIRIQALEQIKGLREDFLVFSAGQRPSWWREAEVEKKVLRALSGLETQFELARTPSQYEALGFAMRALATQGEFIFTAHRIPWSDLFVERFAAIKKIRNELVNLKPKLIQELRESFHEMLYDRSVEALIEGIGLVNLGTVNYDLKIKEIQLSHWRGEEKDFFGGVPDHSFILHYQARSRTQNAVIADHSASANLYRPTRYRNLEGGHTTEVVDVVRGEDGRVQFLVIKNSWGINWAEKGYGFFPRSHFDEIDGAEVIYIP